MSPEPEEYENDLQRADNEGMSPPPSTQPPPEVDKELVEIMKRDQLEGSTPG